MKSKYSKPVLTGTDESSYKDDIRFDLTITNGEKVIQDDGNLLIKFKIDLNSKYLNELLAKGKASLGIKVKASIFSHFESLDYVNLDDAHIIISSSDLKRIDCIKCTAYVIASEDIEIKYFDELDDFYKGDYAFNFHKNEILAESISDKLDYNASGSPFIQFQAQDRTDIGFSLKENVINILINPNLNVAIAKLQDPTKLVCTKDILGAFMAYNAILYSLIKVITDSSPENYYEKDWFKALDSNFDDPRYKNLKDFVETMSGDNISEFDIETLNEEVQKILHNNLNDRIIKTWEAANGSKTN